MLVVTVVASTTELPLLLLVSSLLPIASGGATLFDPEFLVADLDRVRGDGGLVAFGGFEVDEGAVLNKSQYISTCSPLSNFQQ